MSHTIYGGGQSKLAFTEVKTSRPLLVPRCLTTEEDRALCPFISVDLNLAPIIADNVLTRT